ncbi:hypothetical protein HQ585_14080 [candidate division KSB1 bacterium]|nr:hypothetical protein [candidate division KSB1 bacterium]
MNSHPQISGGFLVWFWRDDEIDQPRLIREQLDTIQSRGFSGVLITLCGSRYEIIDPKVIHAVAQASQWAKSRKMMVWLQADPRRASRSLIAETDERTQYLILPPGHSDHSPVESGVIVPAENGQFNLQFPFPALYPYTCIQEQAVRFDPAGLERAFVFQMRDGVILQNTVIDITPATRFHADMNTQTVEIFGEVGVPEEENWFVTAFVRFETNLYDYAGRESNDLLRHFVESLFDSAAYIDGITWDTIGYPGGKWDFPVSLSIYHGFASEFGYDLRDVLHALIFNVDTGLHLQVRQDYNHFLMESILDAQRDLYALFHSYFGTIENALPMSMLSEQNEGSTCCTVNANSWPVIRQVTSAMTHLDWDCENIQVSDQILTNLALLRTQGVFSGHQKAYGQLTRPGNDIDNVRFYTDLMAVFSIRLMLQTTPCILQDINFSEDNDKFIPFGEKIIKLNKRRMQLLQLTGFRFPDADLAVILPVETLMTESHESATNILNGFYQFVANLIRAGFAIDIITASAVNDAKLLKDGLRLQHRIYRGVVIPYPEIVPSHLLDLITAMDRQNFPFWIGGCSPETTTDGKPISQKFDLRFDPLSNDLGLFDLKNDMSRLILPNHGLGSWLHSGGGFQILVCPDAPDQTVQGKGELKGIQFNLPILKQLAVFQLDPKGHLDKLL